MTTKRINNINNVIDCLQKFQKEATKANKALDLMEKKLFVLDFCNWMDIEMTVDMIDSFFVSQGMIFKVCDHPNKIALKNQDSPQGKRNGFKCPDCALVRLLPVGEEEDE